MPLSRLVEPHAPASPMPARTALNTAVALSPRPTPPSLERFFDKPVSPKQPIALLRSPPTFSSGRIAPSRPIPSPRPRILNDISQAADGPQGAQDVNNSLGLAWGECVHREGRQPDLATLPSTIDPGSPVPLSPTSPTQSFHHRVSPVRQTPVDSVAFRSLPRTSKTNLQERRRPALPRFQSDPNLSRPRLRTYPIHSKTHGDHTSPPEFSVPFLPSRIVPSTHPSPFSSNTPLPPFAEFSPLFSGDEVRYPTTPPDQSSALLSPSIMSRSPALYASPPLASFSQLSISPEPSKSLPIPSFSRQTTSPSATNATLLLSPKSSFPGQLSPSTSPPSTTRILARTTPGSLLALPSSSTTFEPDNSKRGLGLSGAFSPPISSIFLWTADDEGGTTITLDGHVDTPQPSPEFRAEGEVEAE